MALLGARFAMQGGGKNWNNPYVTDGLVAMWDGKWNAGGGKHEKSPVSWIDVIQGELQEGSATYLRDSVLLNGLTDTLRNSTLANDVPSIFTFEIALRKLTTTKTYSVPFYVGSNSNFGDRIQINAEGTFRAHVCLNNGIDIYTVNIGGDARGVVGIGYDGTKCYVYHNGVFVGNMSCNPLLCFHDYIGISPKDELNNSLFNGYVYNVRYYKDKVLTADEIAANYAIDKARFGLT